MGATCKFYHPPGTPETPASPPKAAVVEKTHLQLMKEKLLKA
jgi:hypothetical protein